jgi:hypothetical protein
MLPKPCTKRNLYSPYFVPERSRSLAEGRDRSGELPRSRSLCNHDDRLRLACALPPFTAGCSWSHADRLGSSRDDVTDMRALKCSTSSVPPTVCRRRFRFFLLGGGEAERLLAAYCCCCSLSVVGYSKENSTDRTPALARSCAEASWGLP